MGNLVLDITLVPTYTIKKLGIADISVYPSSTFVITNPTIEVTPPGWQKVAIPFTAKGVNILDSDNLGMTSDSASVSDLAQLPDGIYTIKYSFSPANKYFVEKRFLRMDLLECKYANAFLKLDLDVCDLEIKKYRKSMLAKIRLFMDGAMAASNNCDCVLAIQLYKKASELLDEFIDGQCECL